jgi:hypothetical protein
MAMASATGPLGAMPSESHEESGAMPDIIETESIPEGSPEPASVEQASEPKQDEDKPLGAAGEKALRQEREARKALESQLKEMAPLLELVKGLRGAVPGVEPSDTEKLAAELEQIKAEAAQERLGRLRLEVATAKGLTPAQAARLQGETAEELQADAEALLVLFPQTTPDAPKGPRGDPAQGARPGGTSGGIQSGAAKYEARKKQGPTY